MSQMNLRSTTKMNSASSYSLEERLNFLRTKCRQLELEIKNNEEKKNKNKKKKKKNKKKMAKNIESSLGKLSKSRTRSIRIMIDEDCEELIISVVDDSDNLSQDLNAVSSTLNISNEIEEILIEDKPVPKSIVPSHFPILDQSGESIDDATNVSIGSKMSAPAPEPTSTIFVPNFCRPQPRPPTFYYSQPNYDFQPPTPQPQQLFNNLWQPPTTNHFPINSEPYSLYPPMMMIPPNCQQCPQFPMEISSKFEQTESQIPTFILTSSILEQQQQQQQLQNQFMMQNSSMIVDHSQQNPIAYHDNDDDLGQDPSQFSEFCQPSTSANQAIPRKGRQSKMSQKVPKQEEQQFPEERRRRTRRRMGHLLNETPEQRQRRLARMREYSRLRREIKNAENSGISSISTVSDSKMKIRKENGTFCFPPFSKLKQESAEMVDTKPVAKRSKYRRCGKFSNETPEKRQRRLNQMKEYYRKRKMLRVGGK